MIRPVLCFAFFSVTVIGIAGCSGGGGADKPDTVNVSGTVYLDGKPAEGVDVNFMCEKPEFASFGKTGSDGKYTLVQGAVVGTNKVVFSKIEGDDVEMDPEGGMDEGQFEAMASAGDGVKGLKLPQQLIPEEYSDPAKSKLTFEVPAGGTDSADFRLTSK